jgi:uracil-DNA glycosylase family 4
MWLDAEIARVRPKVIVALGATAAGVIIGPSVKVTRDRARRLESTLAPYVTVTVHPSSILRVPDAEGRRAARRAFVADLKKIVKATRA